MFRPGDGGVELGQTGTRIHNTYPWPRGSHISVRIYLYKKQIKK